MRRIDPAAGARARADLAAGAASRSAGRRRAQGGHVRFSFGGLHSESAGRRARVRWTAGRLAQVQFAVVFSSISFNTVKKVLPATQIWAIMLVDVRYARLC